MIINNVKNDLNTDRVNVVYTVSSIINNTMNNGDSCNIDDYNGFNYNLDSFNLSNYNRYRCNRYNYNRYNYNSGNLINRIFLRLKYGRYKFFLAPIVFLSFSPKQDYVVSTHDNASASKSIPNPSMSNSFPNSSIPSSSIHNQILSSSIIPTSQEVKVAQTISYTSIPSKIAVIATFPTAESVITNAHTVKDIISDILDNKNDGKDKNDDYTEQDTQNQNMQNVNSSIVNEDEVEHLSELFNYSNDDSQLAREIKVNIHEMVIRYKVTKRLYFLHHVSESNQAEHKNLERKREFEKIRQNVQMIKEYAINMLTANSNT